ncbi:MAG: type II toxin-antitoxin system Phd/YefM family antitoxin [Gammaproteobacteria bacterium]|nr:MAG: type II toxin-antitoxin system Phd/YefM family antitoxin [Gammaproteobacteria bacterium]
MQSMSAHDAKARFGELLDAARREPVTIEKHGRAVAVVMSKEDFDDIEAMKLEHLRAEVQIGVEASRAGDAIEIDAGDLDEFVEKVMTGGEDSIAG